MKTLPLYLLLFSVLFTVPAECAPPIYVGESEGDGESAESPKSQGVIYEPDWRGTVVFKVLKWSGHRAEKVEVIRPSGIPNIDSVSLNSIKNLVDSNPSAYYKIEFKKPWDESTNEKVRAACDQSLKAAIPESDLPSKQEYPDLTGCASVVYYRGDEILSRDVVKARKCAYWEREHSEKTFTGDDGLGAGSILAMIYANGEGVPFNPGLALRFVCEGDIPMSENLEQVVLLLESAKSKPEKPLDLCHYAYSNVDDATCAAFVPHREAWQQLLDIKMKTWDVSTQRLYDKLDKVAEYFVRKDADIGLWIRCGAITVCSGGWEGSLAVAEKFWVNYYQVLLSCFEEGRLPDLRSHSFKQADAELNRVYPAYIAAMQSLSLWSDDEMIENKGGGRRILAEIRQTQLAWIRYRDAWDAFGKHRYAKLFAQLKAPADFLKVWATEVRTDELRSFMRDNSLFPSTSG